MKRKRKSNAKDKTKTKNSVFAKRKVRNSGSNRKGGSKAGKKLLGKAPRKVQSNKNRKNPKSTKQGYYSNGTGEHSAQITYFFPPGLAENKKVSNLQAWDGKPLQPFINKNRPVNRKGKRVLAVTGEPVPPGAGYRPPDFVWIKLVKRKPRGKEKFFSAEASTEVPLTRKGAQNFAVEVLKNYYGDKVAKIKDKNKTRPLNRHDSDPSDYEGKPLKVDAIIFHFIY